MATLNQMAKEAIAQGYPVGHAWEAVLSTYLKKNCPALVRELGSDLQDYLTVTVNQALEQTVTLTNNGMNPMEAEFVARREMLPMSEEDVEDERSMNLLTSQPETGGTTTKTS